MDRPELDAERLFQGKYSCTLRVGPNTHPPLVEGTGKRHKICKQMSWLPTDASRTAQFTPVRCAGGGAHSHQKAIRCEGTLSEA